MRREWRCVVGKPTVQTPSRVGMMRYANFNPYWNVPSDLVQRRIAPKVLDGATLKGMRYEALSDWTANASVIDPANIDWSAIAQGRDNVRVRQLPGRNKIGRAPCRERVCQYVSISVVAGTIKTQHEEHQTQ